MTEQKCYKNFRQFDYFVIFITFFLITVLYTPTQYIIFFFPFFIISGTTHVSSLCNKEEERSAGVSSQLQVIV